MRLIGIPAAAVAGVLIYSGLRDHFVLPECDSGRAKHTLSDVLKQLKLEPTRYEPIKTVSSEQRPSRLQCGPAAARTAAASLPITRFIGKAARRT